MTLRIFDIARRSIHQVFGIFWLRPLLCDQLSSEELRGRLHDLVLIVDHEQVISSPAIATSRVRRRIRQVVIIVSGLPARSEKSREGIRQPQGAKDIHCSFTPMRVGLGIQ